MQEHLYSKFCPNCGTQIDSKYTVCPNCGSQQPQPADNTPPPYYSQQQSSNDNRWLATLLLCWFLGYLGVHRFYTGSTGLGLIQLFTLGGCGIWWLIDFILILTNSYHDSDGRPLK
ncbi:MAG: NINE protein [Dysgonomonas sp.]